MYTENELVNTNNSETKIITDVSNDKIITKGRGAGGANTNKNGLPYENLTDLSNIFVIKEKKNKFDVVKFPDSDLEFISCQKRLHKYIESINEKNKDILPAKGCKCPDESYVKIDNKKIFIIEKKFQQCSGSVDEKIQTAHFKKQHYQSLFPNYHVEYIYCLSDWFKNGYDAELNYLKNIGIPIFWGSDKDYKNKIINYMIKT